MVILSLAAGGAGYAVGRSTGEDLEEARSDGRAAGERSGSARGAARGYRQGFQRGRRRAYRSAYRKALARTLASGAGQISARPVNRSCGNLVEEGAGTYNVQSVNVVCDIARQVATQWEGECATRPSGSCTVRAGFACSYQEIGEELAAITCTDSDRRVTFQSGA